MAPRRVVPHDVPEDRLAADLDHRLRDPLRLLAHPHAEPAAEDDDLHLAPCPSVDTRGVRAGQLAIRSGSSTRRRRDRHDQLRPPLLGVGELRGDLAREVPGQDHDRVRPRLGDALRRVDRDVRSRREPAVLVRVAVDGVVEEVGADAAVVEQRVALAGRAVADDLLAVAAEARSAARAARASTPSTSLREARVALRVAQPLRLLARDELGDGRLERAPAAAACCA